MKGQSLGKKERIYGLFPAHGLIWQAPFDAGKNRLVAIGNTSNHSTIADTVEVEYYLEKPGKPDKLRLSTRQLANGNHLIEAEAVDETGHRSLQYNRRIYFSHSGMGRLLTAYGTSTGSSILEMANGYAAIEFEPAGTGQATIGATTHDLKEIFVKLSANKIPSTRLGNYEVR